MKWYGDYLEILKRASEIEEPIGNEIYRLAFKALSEYGIAEHFDGSSIIEDSGMVYILDSEQESTSSLSDVNESDDLREDDVLEQENNSSGETYDSINDGSNDNYDSMDEVVNPFGDDTHDFNNYEENPFSEEDLSQLEENPYPEHVDEEDMDGEDINDTDEDVENVNHGDEDSEETPYRYPEYMFKNDFTLELRSLSGHVLKESAVFILYPLRIDVERSVVIFSAKLDSQEVISKTDNNGYAEFISDYHTYIIDCKMEDGKFVVDISVKDVDMSNVEVREKTFGNKGHIALADDEGDLMVHIMPKGFKNNPYGTADFIYCIDQGDDDYYIDSNRSEKSAFITIDDEEYEILGKWQEDVLYAKIQVIDQ